MDYHLNLFVILKCDLYYYAQLIHKIHFGNVFALPDMSALCTIKNLKFSNEKYSCETGLNTLYENRKKSDKYFKVFFNSMKINGLVILSN